MEENLLNNINDNRKIVYRVGILGIRDEKKFLEQIQEDSNHQFAEYENFDIEFVDIKGLSEEKIKELKLHSVIYDMNCHENQNKNQLKYFIESKGDIEDIGLFPTSESIVTEKTTQEEIGRLKALTAKSGIDKLKISPTNIGEKGNKKGFFAEVQMQSANYMELSENVFEQKVQTLEKMTSIFLDKIKEISPFTYDHAVGVVITTIALCNTKQLDKIETLKTIVAALEHDIGKIAVPEQRLNSPDMNTKLNRDEIEIHASKGGVLVDKLFTEEKGFFESDVIGGIAEHHKRGSTNKYANRVAVADVIDAALTQRPYNNPKTIDAVFRELVKGTKGFTNDKGNWVEPQFSKETAEDAIVMLAEQVAMLGYDPMAIIMATSGEYTKEVDKKIQEVLIKNKDRIVINTNAKEGDYNDLGWRLTEIGLVEYRNRPTSQISPETRFRSEVQFKMSKEIEMRGKTDPYYKELFENSDSFDEFKKEFSEEELEGFKASAKARIKEDDERGRKGVLAGRESVKNKQYIFKDTDEINDRPSIKNQLKEAIIGDREYTLNVKKVFSMIREEQTNLKQKENEGRDEIA